MTHGADGARLQHATHRATTVQKPQFVIDQRENAGAFRFFRHARRLLRIQRHRFFTQHCLAVFERRECYFPVGCGRSDDADEVDVVTLGQFLPIVSDVFDAEFSGDCFSAFAASGGARSNKWIACSISRWLRRW
jgi:hypothetical protein